MRDPRFVPFQGRSPVMAEGVYVAPGAVLIGDVHLGAESSVWFHSVLRGDVAPIRIGSRTNIQDLSTLHGTTDVAGVVIGDDVTVGHRVVLHACTIHDRVLVGMGSVVLDLSVIESDVLLAAGSLVTPRTVLPSGHLCAGSPARAVRPLRDREREMIRQGWTSYLELGRAYAGATGGP